MNKNILEKIENILEVKAPKSIIDRVKKEWKN